jgi:hypothetical protein
MAQQQYKPKQYAASGLVEESQESKVKELAESQESHRRRIDVNKEFHQKWREKGGPGKEGGREPGETASSTESRGSSIQSMLQDEPAESTLKLNIRATIQNSK